MFRDIVLPKNNETEFIVIASKLGFKKLYFLYNFDEYNNEKKQIEIQSYKNHTNIEIETGFIVNQKNINKAIKQTKLLVVKSSDKDRFFIESKKVRLIYGFEEVNRKDYFHQRASGLNHILCEIAYKNNVAVGIDYSSLLNKSLSYSSLLMGRMMQNISLCQKYNVKTVIGSFAEKPFEMRSHYDIISLFTMFGMGGKNIKDSLNLNL